MTNIELIKAGKLAIKDNCKDATRKVLNHIWPTDGERLRDEGNFYYQSPDCAIHWHAADKTNLSTIPATELLKEIEQPEWKPKRGELVEISDDGEIWHKRIFLAEIDGLNYPFYTVATVSEDAFKRGDKFHTSAWRHIRPIPTKHKVTKSELLAEYARANGIEVSQIEITD